MESLENATISTILQQSLRILRKNMLPYGLWLPASFTNIITSSLIIWTIGRSKRMRSKYYCKALHLAAANFLTGSCYFVVGSCRIIRAAFSYGEVESPLRCALDSGVLHMSDLTSTAQTLCLAVDRMFAIVFPIYYFQVSTLASQCYNAVAWLASILIPFGVMLLGVSPEPLVTNCQYVSTYKLWAEDIAEYLVILYILATVLCYCVIIYVSSMYQKQRPIARQQLARRLHQERQRRLTVVSGLVTLSFMATWAVSFVYEIVVGKMPNLEDRRRLMPYNAILPQLSCEIDLLLYCRFDAEFMAAFKTSFSCFQRRRNSVASLVEFQERSTNSTTQTANGASPVEAVSLE